MRKEVQIGKLKIKYKHKPKNETWGRFGGGWNWIVGIQAGGSCLTVNLLVASLRFTLTK